jgi:hypothetical protein
LGWASWRDRLGHGPAVAGVVGVGVAVLGIVAAVAIARWQNRQAKRSGPTADGAADPPGPVFNQPDQSVGQQINVAGGVANIALGAGPLPAATRCWAAFVPSWARAAWSCWPAREGWASPRSPAS